MKPSELKHLLQLASRLAAIEKILQPLKPLSK